ncbi:hypothetical protein [Longispora urticae]
MDPQAGDFLDLLQDALAQLASQSGLGDQKLLAALDVVIGDTIRFRKELSSPYGSIPWLSGEALITSSTKLLEAAAKAERERAPYFGNKQWTSARAYLEEVRMGQTEVGSYVVTAFSPVGEISGPALPLFEYGDPVTGRAVAKTLTTALEATREAIDYFNSRASLVAFDAAVEHGVSYELAKGLTGLIAQSDGADVSVSWSQNRGIEEVGPASSRFEFEPSDIPALERARDRFAITEPPIEVTVIGTVTLLDRARSGTAGVIRLDVIEGSQAKKLRVRMPQKMYELAIQAHRRGMAIRVSGRQKKSGRYFWLSDPRNVELIPIEAFRFAEVAMADEEYEDEPLPLGAEYPNGESWLGTE